MSAKIIPFPQQRKQTPAQVANVLRAAQSKIANPVHWTQGAIARDVNGKHVNAKDRRAVRWCILGAIHSVTDWPITACQELLLTIDVNGATIGQFNDTHSHEHVLALMDETIGYLENEERVAA